ncbi:DUF192 domain-containing protein [Robertkochia aurantiaca]|uniref:DUF192 domain-containing protein n=1 Tax=Robertkochia aurantiaca TaxID=2873700 RepID=UPI001CCED643|nr:DUF192 domain-containing protein [Robertkochia sp. 3YJGBD-33]
MHKLFLCGIAILTLLTVSCKEKTSHPSRTAPEEIPFEQDGLLSIWRNDSLIVKDLAIEISDDEYERSTGLMYRYSMKNEQGMLFIFPDSQERFFYMKDTEFPLDIIYFDADQKLVSIIRNAEPLNEKSLPSGAPSQYVLEVNAGLSDRWNLQKGDSIGFEFDR